MAFAVKYYRSPEAATFLARHGILKPPGWFVSQARYNDREAAQKDANHLTDAGIKTEVVGHY